MSDADSTVKGRRKSDKAGPTELYRHFDKKGDLLYVGISLNTAMRLLEHRRGSHWADQIATVTIQRFRTRKAALEAERKAVQTEHPLHNITGKLRGFRVTASVRVIEPALVRSKHYPYEYRPLPCEGESGLIGHTATLEEQDAGEQE